MTPKVPTLFDLHSTTLPVETPGADLRIVEKDSVQPGTEEDKPGDFSLTVAEWAELMAPHFHEASQLVPFRGRHSEKSARSK